MSWRRLVSGALLALPLGGCDLPPGFNELEPDEAEGREVGTADVSPVPAGEDRWETDFVGWQFGGGLACGGPGDPTAPGGGAVRTPFPVVIQIWDGPDDPCAQTPAEGDRVVQIELSDNRPGTYEVALQCVGPQTARVVYGRVLGGQLFARTGLSGTVSIVGVEGQIATGDIRTIEGVFSVRFGPPSALGSVQTGGIPVIGGEQGAPAGIPIAGSFRGESRCF